jgi:hypothetical protein
MSGSTGVIIAGAAETGHVDQDVEPAELLDGRLH